MALKAQKEDDLCLSAETVLLSEATENFNPLQMSIYHGGRALSSAAPILDIRTLFRHQQPKGYGTIA